MLPSSIMQANARKRKIHDQSTSTFKERSNSPDEGLFKKSRFFGPDNSEPPSPPITTSSMSSATLSSTSPRLPPLLNLLDCRSLHGYPNYSALFHDIARSLIHEHSLVLKCGDVETKFQILELEFYFQKEGVHEDPYTHGSEEQKFCGGWYFHRAPRRSKDATRSATSLTGYRGGSRKGLDLTLGQPAGTSDSTSLLRGGILLRSIRRLGNASAVISGPSLLVDEILSRSKAARIIELVNTKWNGDTFAFLDPPRKTTSSRETMLFLEPSTSHVEGVPPQIYRSPRIGLDLSHPAVSLPPAGSTSNLHPRFSFVTKPYRYFICPNELRVNGRAQTFVGVFNHLLSEEMQRSSSPASAKPPNHSRAAIIHSTEFINLVSEAMGLQERTVQKYIDDYEAGRSGGRKSLEGFVGKKGKGKASSSSGWLTMSGAVDSVTTGGQC